MPEFPLKLTVILFNRNWKTTFMINSTIQFFGQATLFPAVGQARSCRGHWCYRLAINYFFSYPEVTVTHFNSLFAFLIISKDAIFDFLCNTFLVRIFSKWLRKKKRGLDSHCEIPFSLKFVNRPKLEAFMLLKREAGRFPLRLTTFRCSSKLVWLSAAL